MNDNSQQGVASAMRRYWAMSLIIICAMAALSVAVTQSVAPDTEATATIGLITPTTNNVLAPGAQGDATLARYTTQRARFVTSDEVLGAVATELGDATIEDLRPRIRASAASSSNVITIVAEAPEADAAVALATAVVNAYRSETRRQITELTDAAIASLTASADQVLEAASASPSDVVGASTAATIGTLQLQAADLETSRALLGDGVEFAVAPNSASVVEPGIPVRELALGILLGTALAATAAWMRADRHRQVVDQDSVSEILQTTCLAEISRTSRRVHVADLPTIDHRLAWTATSRRIPQGVLVVQPLGLDSAALVTVGLATAGARNGSRVLVVDADVEDRGVSSLLGQSSRKTGLTTLLAEGSAWANEVVPVQGTQDYGFSLLPCGPQVDDVEVSTSSLRSYTSDWRSTYDFVLVNIQAHRSEPLAVDLETAADGLIAVVGMGVAEIELENLRRRAQILDVPIVGFVLVGPGRQPRTVTSEWGHRAKAVPMPSPDPRTSASAQRRQ
jgi:Mrp family chromosome partitioning ATPase